MKKITIALMALLAMSYMVKAQQYVSTEPANRNAWACVTQKMIPFCFNGMRFNSSLTKW